MYIKRRRQNVMLGKKIGWREIHHVELCALCDDEVCASSAIGKNQRAFDIAESPLSESGLENRKLLMKWLLKDNFPPQE